MFIAMIEYKTIIKIIIMYSIGNTPIKGQDLTAYPLLAHLITKPIITALDRFCNIYLLGAFLFRRRYTVFYALAPRKHCPFLVVKHYIILLLVSVVLALR